MPQKHQPKRLEMQALISLGQWIKMVARNMDCKYFADPYSEYEGKQFLQSCVRQLREILFTTVPCYLFNKMATQVLTALSDLIKENISNSNNIMMAVTLADVVMHPQLKQIQLCDWPKILCDKLCQNLDKLEGLEILNLGYGTSGCNIMQTEKFALSGVQVMSNLTTFDLSFDCTDKLISALGEHCPQLQNLDVTYSRSVTDSSIRHLLKCKKLRHVILTKTAVTLSGLKDLLSGLPHIQDIGQCKHFGTVLQMLHEDNCHFLPLLSIHCNDMNVAQSYLLVDICPLLTTISLCQDLRIMNLSVLSSLDNLKELKLRNSRFYSSNIKDLLKVVGINLNYLLFDSDCHVDMEALVYISQSCPNLKSLLFTNCQFSYSSRDRSFNTKRLPVVPFTNLERLVCISDCTFYHLEFMFSHCKNIRYIQLSSSTGINDATLACILDKNPMPMLEEFRILYGEDLSMTSVHRLMKCERLHNLSELQGWDGITFEEFTNFIDYLHDNNIDLITDASPCMLRY